MKFAKLLFITFLVLISSSILAQTSIIAHEPDVLVLTAGVPFQKIYYGNDSQSTQLTWYVWNISNQPVYLLQAKVSGANGCKYNFFPINSSSSGVTFFNCSFTNSLPAYTPAANPIPIKILPGRIYQIPVTLRSSGIPSLGQSFPFNSMVDLNVVVSTHPGYLSSVEYFRQNPNGMNSFYRNNGYVQWNEQHFVSKQSWAPFTLNVHLIENQHFNVKLKASNACITGSTAAPKLLFNWRFDSINENTCTTATNSSDSNFCDLTQFSISLTQRLQKLRTAAPTERSQYLTWDTYLLSDNYASAQFKQDFASYYTNTAFLGESSTNFTNEDGWKKYFAQNKIVYDFNAIQAQAFDTESGKYKAGKYTIQLGFAPKADGSLFDYVFFQSNNPTTAVRAKFTSFEPVQYQTPLHAFAFDGHVGQSTTRRDYGTGFALSGGTTPLNITSDFVFAPDTSTVIPSNTNFAYTVNSNSFDGNVLKIQTINSHIFSFDFAPSQANPVLLGGLHGFAFYSILDTSGAQIDKTKRNNLTLQYASVCSNKETIMPETNPTPARNGTCATDSNPMRTYGFDIPQDEKVFYSTVLYTPYTGNYSLRSSCTVRPDQIIATSTNIIAPHQTNTINLSNTLDKANTVQEVIHLIRNERLCMKPANGTDNSWSYYWNEKRILESLNSIKERVNQSLIINLQALYCPRDESS